MAWTSPRSWVAGEVVTAALLNSHLRDQLLELNGTASAWSSFTVGWGSSGANPTLGNGASVGQYKTVGKTCHFVVAITTGSTTTAGTGDYKIQLPVTAVTEAGLSQAVTIHYTSTEELNGSGRIISGGTTIGIFSVNNAKWTAGTPAMPTGTVIAISGTYQTA